MNEVEIFINRLKKIGIELELMKTPIQKLIDKWEGLQKESTSTMWLVISKIFIEDAKAMLEEETNMVDAAYTTGATKGVEFERGNQNGIWQEWPNGFDYYTQTFNTTDK